MAIAAKRKAPFTAVGLRNGMRIGWFRRVAGVALLALIAVGAVLYRHETRPEYVWARAHAYLTRLTGGEVSVGSASFSLFDGIRLRQVRVSLSVGSGFDPRGSSDRDREVFYVDELHLKPSVWRAVLGRPAVREIVASNPVFSLVRRMEDGRYNWQQLLESRLVDPNRSGIPLPTIRLRDSEIRLRKLSDQGLTDLDTLRLNVLADSEASSAATYSVRWQQRGERSKRGTLHIFLDPPGFDAGSDGLPSLNVEAVLAAMPGNVDMFAEWLALLDLRGRLGVEALCVSEPEPDQAVVRLEGLSLSIPLDAEERRCPPEQRRLRLDQVNGTVKWTAGRIDVRLAGELNGRPCRLDGAMFAPSGEAVTWAEVGFGLRLNAERFELPSMSDDADNRWASLIQRFAPLRYLYDRYDPHGCFDIDLSVNRQPGADQPVRLTRCVLTALGVDAMYVKFPVRLTDLQGRLEYTPDGITIHELTGCYGNGTVIVTGRSERVSPVAGVDLTIEGRNIPLDDALYAALQPQHRKVWRRFSPDGCVNTVVRLAREDRLQEPAAPFHTSVDIEFLGMDARFDSLPYPLHGIRGRVVVDQAGTRIESLAGNRGKTRVVVSGIATPDERGDTVLDLNLAVTDLELDTVLIESLPENARQAIQRFGLRGRADLNGRIFTSAPTGETLFDVTGSLRDGTAQHELFPIKLYGVQGRFRIRPDRTDLFDWRGIHDQAEVRIAGTAWLSDQPGQDGLPWRVRCDAVRLTDELREALPSSIVGVWDELGATGQLQVEIDYERNPPEQADSYRATITACGNSIRLCRFPWALEGVTGQVVVTPDAVELRDLRGRHGDAKVALEGAYDRLAASTLVSVHATNVALDEELRQAVPWRVRRSWNVLKPRGRIDLDLARLELVSDPAGKPVCRYDGRLGLIEAGLETGVSLQGVYGSLEGKGVWSAQGGWTLEASVELDRCRLNRHWLRHVRCDLSKSADPAGLELTGITADAHRGRAMGRAYVDLGEAGGYEFSLLALDMDLGPFLEAMVGPRHAGRSTYGKVQGNLYYAAEFDHPDRGRGGGELHVRGGALFRTPIMLSILHMLDPVPPWGNYQDAHVKFYMSQRQLNLHSIVIRDRGLAMTGTGTMSWPGKNLNVTFLVGGPPEPSSPLTVIPEFLQGALRELVEIRVVGRPDHPRIEARPLRGIDEALRILTESREGVRP